MRKSKSAVIFFITVVTIWGIISLNSSAFDTGSDASIIERVLPNLLSESVSDPLGPLRANHPSASEMAATSRQHPYLFFDAQSREALRARAQTEPFLGLAQRLRAHAEECLKRPIPPKAVVVDGMPKFLPNGSYNPEFLKHNYDDLYKQAYIVKEVIPTLAFAYQLTGDIRFGNAGKEWLLNFAARSQLVKKSRAADFDAANMLFGLTLGYDWLWELLSDPQRQKVRQALIKLARPIAAAGKHLLNDANPDFKRGYLGNNHQTRTHGLFGLTPLTLLYEVPEAAEWLDVEIQLQRDRLYPSAWAPDGEHIDAWDHFNSSLSDPIAFVVALKHLGGEDFFNDPSLASRFRGIPSFYLYGLEYIYAGPSNNYAWLALASNLNDPVAQWIATRNNGLQKTDEIFAYLFYNPQVPASTPVAPKESLYWPYSGMVKMVSDWDPQGILVPFRCGPEIGKDLGDQNGFRLRADGEWLLPRLSDAQRNSDQPVEFQWDLWAWFRGSPAQNVIVLEPNAIGDFETYKQTGKIPLNGGVQFAQYPPIKGHHLTKQWLGSPEVPKNGELRVVHFDEALDYVLGEAHRAYTHVRPNLWLRHILFVKGQKDGLPAYVIICDEAESDQQPRTFAWQLHSKSPLSIDGHNVSITGKLAELDVRLLAPEDGVIIDKQTPAPQDKERTHFIQWQTTEPQHWASYLTALIPRAKGDATVLPTFRILKAAGGWAVQVKNSEATDVAIFRSERSKSVTAADVSTTGTAALLRKRRNSPATLYVLGAS